MKLVICRDVDGSRVYHTEWSKSEREKQISSINAYMWNLEKWYRWSYLQGRNRDPDAENKCMDTKGERGGGRNWEVGTDIYTLLTLRMKWVTNEKWLYSTRNSIQCSVETQTGRKSKKKGSEVVLVVKNQAPNAGDIRDAGLIPG